MRSIVLGAGMASAAAYIPAGDDEVLERLRSTPWDAEARELRQVRERLSNDPQNLALAAQFARACIQRSRTEADPRFLGRAQAALGPWWNTTPAPAEALVLRATIRQSQHDFTNALADLDIALKEDPRNPQAWLTKATILTVMGDYAAARRACAPLAQLAPGLLAVTAAANVCSLNGEAEQACGLLRKTLELHPDASRAERLWALTILGEASARLGLQSQAEAFLKQALLIDPVDVYLKCAVVDLLMDQGKAAQASDLLQEGARTDALLLRLVLAESLTKSQDAVLAKHRDLLRDRFAEGHLRGDFVHQREEAQFVLHLLGNSKEALKLAQENWRVQHEPADARILLESALAANQPAAAEPVLDFMHNSHIQDVRLNQLARGLKVMEEQ